MAIRPIKKPIPLTLLVSGTRSFHVKLTADRLFEMTTLTDNYKNSRIREYDLAKSAVFLKTKERFGALSNMAGGFPLHVNGVKIRTSEALYQACRFPHRPEIQDRIIAERSPMAAKMKSKPHRQNSRADWDSVRVNIMRWCLRVKLVQNWNKFRDALLETEDFPIVELSRRDDFWGAKLMQDRTLVGVNALGRLLMELREQIKKEPSDFFQYVEPLPIPDFLLRDRQISKIYQLSDNNRNWMLNGSERRSAHVEISVPETKFGAVSVDNAAIADRTRVNINTASASALQSHLGVTRRQAKRIIEHRESNGPFPTADSICLVHGIGEKTNQKIADKIMVGPHILSTQPRLCEISNDGCHVFE